MTTTLAPDAAFVPVTILIEHNGEITRHTFIGQPIAPGLAITPGIGRDGFNGEWTITHVPTGHRVYGVRGCLACVSTAAKHLTDSGVDWTRENRDDFAADSAAGAAAEAYGNLVRECEGSACDMWAVTR